MEKQQKKLEGKGITVELSQLRREWEAARNGGRGGNFEPIQEHEIDVVGDDESDGEEESDHLSPSPFLPPPAGVSLPFASLPTASPPFTSLPTTASPPLTSHSPIAALSNTGMLKLRNNFSIDNLLAVKSGGGGGCFIKQEESVIKTEVE